MIDLVATAVDIARRTHAGSVDKSGAGYLGHVARVAARVSRGGIELEAVAWLHDTVEEGGVTLTGLSRAGFPQAVVEAVDALSRRPAEADGAYLERVMRSPLARVVKRADAADNADPRRLSQLDPATRLRLATKYAAMRDVLGLYSDVSPAVFAAMGADDLEWIGEWDSDPLALYESYRPAIASRAIALVREACLEQAIVTPLIRSCLSDGVGLKGLQHRVKSPASTALWLTRAQDEAHVDEDPKDMVRYTGILRPDAMWDDAAAFCSGLAGRLDPMRARSFFVGGNSYYGLHVWWRGVGSHMIELQLHSTESHSIKERMHDVYETYRSPSAPPAARRDAWRELVAAWSAYPIPEGCPAELAGIPLQRRAFPAPTESEIHVRSIVLS